MSRKQSKMNAKRAAKARAEKAAKAAEKVPPKQKSNTSWKKPLEREMRENIRANLSGKSNKYQHSARRETENFIQWCKELQEREHLSADYFRNVSREELAQRYIDHLRTEGATVRDRVKNGPTKTVIRLDKDGHASYRSVARSSVEQYSKNIASALGVDWKNLNAPKTSILEKSRSTGSVARAAAARLKEENAAAVRFAELVGCRRDVMERLTGADWCKDSSGVWGVRLMNDKHGKDNFHPIAPEHLQEVAAYFKGKEPNERIFPNGVDSRLDVHGIRAERCRAEYARYVEMCKDPAARAALREQLLNRFRDPVYGNKSYLNALARGEGGAAAAKLNEFKKQLRYNIHHLRGENAAAAFKNGRPVEYNRLALTAASVFSVDHWRNHNTLKYYMIS